MIKIAQLAGQLLGNKKGLISLISEKTGKISFKRTGSIMVIAWIINSVSPSEITTTHAIIIIGCLLSVALPKILEKEDK